jgi:hypothetical protein
MSLSEQLIEEYREAFRKPDGQVRLLTKSQAQFIRAVMRCNEINETSRTYDKKRIKQTNNTT